MELVNATPLPAKLLVSEQPGQEQRWSMIAAKATYRFDSAGPLDLETAEPVPLLPGDAPTPFGLLPRDDLPRNDPEFEVVVLGQAHAPKKKATQMRVKLRVGSVQRELAVFGDRVWQGAGPERRIGPPAPFAKMPLVWERAYGGKADILIDADSPVAVADPVNQYGKGFDHTKAVEGLRETFSPPPGYPKFDPVRPLPNLEDPKALIANWDDLPRPLCWATLPMDLGPHVARLGTTGQAADGTPAMEVGPGAFHRAHPDWVIPLPKAGSAVVLDGLTADELVAFHLPRLRVLVDWIVGGETGTSELVPQMLVLLPEQRRFYLVYRFVAAMAFQPEVERSLRLRLAEGWYQPPKG